MSRVTTGCLTFWLPEIVAGTDGVEPSSSGLQPDARTVAAAFPNAISCASSHSEDGAMPRSRGRARPAQRHGASKRAARESRARLFLTNDSVFKGRVESDVHDRARAELV